MTRITPPPASQGEAPVTLRDHRKQLTRCRLVEAARQVFMEQGYDAATLRDIAALADLSTGAVFVTFADKADLFSAVLVQEQIVLSDLMERVDTRSLNTRDALVSLMGVAYDRDLEQIGLVRSAISFSFQRGPEAEARERGGLRLVLYRLVEVIERGIARREISQDLDACLCAEMIWNLYQSSFRQVIFGDWNVSQLLGRIAAQVDTILMGYARAA